MSEEGYVVTGGGYQKGNEFYVVVSGQYQALQEAYVVVDGNYQRFFIAEAIKGIQESLSFTETTDLVFINKLSATDTITLSESLGRFIEDRNKTKGIEEGLSFTETTDLAFVNKLSATDAITLGESLGKFVTSDGPSSLTASWDSTNCGMDLDWTADTQNSQDIYRCSGSSCDPQTDGTQIDSVSAGVEHYDDGDGSSTTPDANSGDYTYQIVSSAGSSNEDTQSAGLCPS